MSLSETAEEQREVNEAAPAEEVDPHVASEDRILVPDGILWSGQVLHEIGAFRRQ